MGESKITGEAENPHCKEFQQLLANKELKSSLITFLMNKFRSFAMQPTFQMGIIFYYEDLLDGYNSEQT